MAPQIIDSFRGPYSFLSNLYPCEIVYEGLNYPTTEHCYQAVKTLDKITRIRIAQLSNPVDAKKIGKSLEIREDWEDIKAFVMYTLLELKFSQEKFKKLLLSTGNAQLIDGNWWGDTYWGVSKGVGMNYLGKLLMKIREKLRN